MGSSTSEPIMPTYEVVFYLAEWAVLEVWAPVLVVVAHVPVQQELQELPKPAPGQGVA